MNDFDASARANFKANLASAAGESVSPDDISMAVSPGSVTIAATIRVAGAEAAKTAVSGVSTAISTAANGGGFLGFAVTETPAKPTTAVVINPAPSPPPKAPPLAPPVHPAPPLLPSWHEGLMAEVQPAEAAAGVVFIGGLVVGVFAV
eukprot:3163009-Prymnesium_polylepis.1